MGGQPPNNNNPTVDMFYLIDYVPSVFHTDAGFTYLPLPGKNACPSYVSDTRGQATLPSAMSTLLGQIAWDKESYALKILFWP